MSKQEVNARVNQLTKQINILQARLCADLRLSEVQRALNTINSIKRERADLIKRASIIYV